MVMELRKVTHLCFRPRCGRDTVESLRWIRWLSRKDTRLTDAMTAVLQPLLTALVENPQATGPKKRGERFCQVTGRVHDGSEAVKNGGARGHYSGHAPLSGPRLGCPLCFPAFPSESGVAPGSCSCTAPEPRPHRPGAGGQRNMSSCSSDPYSRTLCNSSSAELRARCPARLSQTAPSRDCAAVAFPSRLGEHKPC